MKLKLLCLLLLFNAHLNAMRQPYTSHDYYVGIRAEDFNPPSIFPGSRVLDVGSGDGIITQKLRDMVGADYVWALEPNAEAYKTLIGLLGASERYRQQTLQQALAHDSSLRDSFDVVTVMRYNIPFIERDAFINALAQVVKPTGRVIIMSVERGRFFEDSYYQAFYIRAALSKQFAEISFMQCGDQDDVQYGMLTLQKKECCSWYSSIQIAWRQILSSLWQ